jgi:hypothetical protein
MMPASNLYSDPQIGNVERRTIGRKFPKIVTEIAVSL